MTTSQLRRFRHYLALCFIALLINVMFFYAWPAIESKAMGWMHVAPITAHGSISSLPQAGVRDPGVSPAVAVAQFPVAAPISSTYKLAVPYTSQAPYRQWGQDTYENGCEEASLLMVDKYWQKKNLNADIATKAIYDMVAWQKTNWGAHSDLTISRLVDFAAAYYGPIYQSSIYQNPTEDELKMEIATGHPIIIPVMSHSLGNPYYGPNDFYHMLVLNGYDQNSFVSNDPGVNPGQGQDYHYTYDVLNKAMGAQVNHLAGQGKVALAIYPK